MKITLRRIILTINIGALLQSCIHQLPDQDTLTRKESDVIERANEHLSKYEDQSLLKNGYLDVTLAPYHADPTGQKDATEAIQRAIKDARDGRVVTFLPAGEYLISNTIFGVQGSVEWDHWFYDGSADPYVQYASSEFPCVLIGPSEGGRAKLILADNSEGFNDPDNPKPVVHFWARRESGRNIDPAKPQSNINFNQKIIDIDFDLGKGNSGAVAINHQGAENSAIEDINIKATGAFAGLQNAPGSGGSMHGITVDGGQYGLYIKNKHRWKGSQPSPEVSSLKLINQEKKAILFDGRGPLTIVGAYIEGAGIQSDCSIELKWDGSLNVVDAIMKNTGDEPAISGNHSIVVSNVYIENAQKAIEIKDHQMLPGNPEGWLHIEVFAGTSSYLQGKQPDSTIWTDVLWVDGRKSDESVVNVTESAPQSLEQFVDQHDWAKPFPSRLSKGAVNVKEAPYFAKGDGVTDDADAIQRALDEHKIVFLPKGVFAISKSLVLGAKNKLIGVGNVQTVITAAADSDVFDDADHPQPLITTVDDPNAETVLAFLRLAIPILNPCVSAIHWKAGANSVVRDVEYFKEHWHPAAPVMGYPMVLISNSGGGKWFNSSFVQWWSMGPDYRHIKIEGTSQPLSFYMLEPQHARSTAMVEIVDSRNIDIFGAKSEGDYGVYLIKNSSQFRVFGYAGLAMPRPGYSIFNITSSDDYLLANINPQHKGLKSYTALTSGNNPLGWNIVHEKPDVPSGEVRINGTGQFSLYKRGNPK